MSNNESLFYALQESGPYYQLSISKDSFNFETVRREIEQKLQADFGSNTIISRLLCKYNHENIWRNLNPEDVLDSKLLFMVKWGKCRFTISVCNEKGV